MTVIDGSKATASGEGLGKVKANQLTSFDVVTNNVNADAALEVGITCKPIEVSLGLLILKCSPSTYLYLFPFFVIP